MNDAESAVTVATVTRESTDAHPRQWRMLAVVAIAELLGMSLWFAANAVSTTIARAWALVPSSASAWLTTTVQLGFVAGTAVSALLNLADILPTRRYFAGAAVSASAVNAALLVAPSFEGVLLTRFLTGFFLAGVYPPAMKMAATWFRAQRGLAIGTVVGALTVGKAAPYLILALSPSTAAVVAPNGLASVSINHVLITASIAGLTAALLVLVAYRDGPYAFQPRPFTWRLVVDVAREPRWRLATTGYLGHMWELYAFWAWIPVFIGASLITEADEATSPTLGPLIAFGAIAIGGLGCIWGGIAADRSGRERLVILAMAASGSCALLTPLVFGRSTWLLAFLVAAWGFFVIADSAQFSTLITESVPSHAVGTALTLQTCLGFLLTAFSIQIVPLVVEFVGWKWAFPMLALGPLVGIVATRRLVVFKRSVGRR